MALVITKYKIESNMYREFGVIENFNDSIKLDQNITAFLLFEYSDLRRDC